MPRKKHDIRISIKDNRSGELHRIELVSIAGQRSFLVRYNGANSKKVKLATLTEVCSRIRKLLTTTASTKSSGRVKQYDNFKSKR